MYMCLVPVISSNCILHAACWPHSHNEPHCAQSVSIFNIQPITFEFGKGFEAPGKHVVNFLICTTHPSPIATAFDSIEELPGISRLKILQCRMYVTVHTVSHCYIPTGPYCTVTIATRPSLDWFTLQRPLLEPRTPLAMQLWSPPTSSGSGFSDDPSEHDNRSEDGEVNSLNAKTLIRGAALSDDEDSCFGGSPGLPSASDGSSDEESVYSEGGSRWVKLG